MPVEGFTLKKGAEYEILVGAERGFCELRKKHAGEDKAYARCRKGACDFYDRCLPSIFDRSMVKKEICLLKLEGDLMQKYYEKCPDFFETAEDGTIKPKQKYLQRFAYTILKNIRFEKGKWRTWGEEAEPETKEPPEEPEESGEEAIEVEPIEVVEYEEGGDPEAQKKAKRVKKRKF